MKKTLFIPTLLLLVSSVFAPAQAQTPVAGKDYTEIRNGSPLKPAEGKVVVEEFFNYICPGCYSLEPVFESWTKQLPSYVKVEHIPAAFRADFVQYAHAYYAAQIFNIVDKTHKAVYDAVHRTHEIPAEGDKPDEERIAAFYSKFGVEKQEFLTTMRSYRVEIMIRRAMDHLKRSKIASTPAIVINGRYLVRGASYPDMLRTATFLIEMEHWK